MTLEKILAKHKSKLSRKQKTLAQKLSKATRYELAGCWINAGWQEQALANLVFARKTPAGFVLSMLMVDLGCQGVRDVNILMGLTPTQVEEVLAEALPEGERVDVGVAMAILIKALGFAAKFEFEPHPQYIVAAAFLRGLEPDARALQTVVVGDGKGKPVYYYGLFESEEESKAVRAKLDALCGPRGYRTRDMSNAK